MILAILPEADRFQRLAGVLFQPRLHPFQPGPRFVDCRRTAPRQIEPDSHVLSSPGGPDPPDGMHSAMPGGPGPPGVMAICGRSLAIDAMMPTDQCRSR